MAASSEHAARPVLGAAFPVCGFGFVHGNTLCSPMSILVASKSLHQNFCWWQAKVMDLGPPSNIPFGFLVGHARCEAQCAQLGYAM